MSSLDDTVWQPEVIVLAIFGYTNKVSEQELQEDILIPILRPMNIKNGHLAGLCPAFCRPINIHRPAANEHLKCSLV